MKQLSRPAPTTGAFRRVEDWGQAFRRNFTAAIAAGIEAALIRRAETMFFRLCDTQATRILLHGDLHHDNVVRDDRRGWLAIDPKGVLGEPAYETGAALRNPIENGKLCADAQTIDRRARLMSEQLGYPFERIIGWCFAQWLLAVLWAVEDGLAFSPDWLEGPRAAAGLIA